MKKTILACCITLAASGANAAGLDDISVSGFGSVALGQADNAVGYAGYTDDKLDWEQETLIGIQFDFQINERAKFVTQLVANSRYDFDPKIEMGYVAYDFGAFTARAGKLRLPLFLYSDYIDLGYGYPMLRPSAEVYSNVILKSYTGAELLIPVEFENSSLLIQPVVGIAAIEEEDSSVGEIKFDNMLGLSTSWNYDDWTLRSSYFIAESNTTTNDPRKLGTIAALDMDDQDGSFGSVGAQYDNGSLLANIEATKVKLDGASADTKSVSGLVGYRIGDFTPYVAAGWIETTDDHERAGNAAFSTLSYERVSYSLGSRWDLDQNMALKLDATHTDFKDTSGGTSSNIPGTASYKDDSLVISARLDFIF